MISKHNESPIIRVLTRDHISGTTSILLLLFLLLLSGCQQDESVSLPATEVSVPDTLYSSEFEVVVGLESDPFGMMWMVRRVDDRRFAVVDMQEQVVRVFATDGTELFHFGGEGRGPGEWEEYARSFSYRDSLFLLKDSGNLRVNMYDREGVPLSSVSIEARYRYSGMYQPKAGLLVLSTNGYEGALAKVLNLYDPDAPVQKIGEPVEDPPEGMADLARVRERMTQGEIPALIINEALVAANDLGTFILMNSLGELRFYGTAGNLEWSRQLPEEVTRPIHEHIIERNRSTSGHGYVGLEYAGDMRIFEDALYLLMTPENTGDEESPQNLLVYSLNGELIQRYIITGEGGDLPGFVTSFDLLDDGAILFTDRNGRILRTALP